MRLNTPRIEPVAYDKCTDEQKEELDKTRRGEHIGNIFLTLAHHPKLMKRWMVFGNHILFKSSLPARDREIAILRVGYLCRAGYEWGHHVQIGKERAGLTDEDIERIGKGPAAPGWSPLEKLLLEAVDELHNNKFVEDDTWRDLGGQYDRQQMMDLVFTVGQYTMVSMALNTFGVQLEPGYPALDA